jgi:2-desacetyl-2-hydroxyethyl bacteriochlorophyllide A dehydrogenase
MRALLLTGPRAAQVVETDEPEAGAGEVLIAPQYVGICGTDLELYDGSMPYFAQGFARFPLQPGHEVAGVVVGSAPGLPAGTRVLVDPVVGCGVCAACATGVETRCSARRELGIRNGMPGGMSEVVAVPARKLFVVPESVTLREAIFAEPAVAVLHAANRLGDVAGRRTLVVGAGTLGLIGAQLLAARGAEVDVLVVEPPRLPLVEQLGLHAVDRAETAAYHAVVEAAGTAAAFHTSLAAVAPGGGVALVGVQPAPVDGVDVNELVLKDAVLHGILSGPGLHGAMLDELARGTVDAAALIEEEYELADAVEAFAAAARPGRAAPKIVLRVADA